MRIDLRKVKFRQEVSRDESAGITKSCYIRRSLSEEVVASSKNSSP